MEDKITAEDMIERLGLEQKPKFSLHVVMQQRELLIAYEKTHYTPEEWVLSSEQCIKKIDEFMAINFVKTKILIKKRN